MRKTIIKTLICLLLNISLFAVLKIIFYDKIVIIWHIEKNLLFFSWLSILIALVIISYILSKNFNLNILKIILNMIISVSIGFFGLNIKNTMKAIYNIITYNDIIFKCKFFSIQYIYSKLELLNYIDYNNSNLWKINISLPYQEKLKILKDAKTVAEVKANIETYYNYESTALWPQFIELLNNFVLNHPNIVICWTIFIWVLVGYYGYVWLKTKMEMGNSVNDLNGEIYESICNLKNCILHSNNTITMIDKAKQIIINKLLKYLKSQFDYEDPGLSEDQNIIRQKLLELTKKLIYTKEEITSSRIEFPSKKDKENVIINNIKITIYTNEKDS